MYYIMIIYFQFSLKKGRFTQCFNEYFYNLNTKKIVESSFPCSFTVTV